MIPWSGLSLGLGVVSVTSLGTLAVVATVNEVDGLSTIALALAVLAFAAQLVMSLAQGQATARQSSDTARVNSETRGLLAEITTSSQALLSNQREQYGRLLDAVLSPNTINQVVREAASETAGDDDSAVSEEPKIDVEALAAKIENEFRNRIFTTSAGGVSKSRPKRKEFQSFVDEMESFPPEAEGLVAIGQLESLPNYARLVLIQRVVQDLSRAHQGVEPRGWMRDSRELSFSSKLLVEREMLEYVDGYRGDLKVKYRYVTPAGRLVGRLVTAVGDPPEWLRSYQQRDA